MLEEEAKAKARNIYTNFFGDIVAYPEVLQAIAVGVLKGAEFEYNKVNEWYFTNRNEYHQVIDCPKGEENKLYLLLLNSSDSKEFEFGRKVPVVCYWNEEWCRFERLEHTIGERVVNPNDINAWKEIVLPELKENE